MASTNTALGFEGDDEPTVEQSDAFGVTASNVTYSSGSSANVTYQPAKQASQQKVDVRSLRDRIFGTKLSLKTVHVPQWGVDVGVRALSAGERVSWVQSRQDAAEDDVIGGYASLLSKTIVSLEDGQPIFSPDDDIAGLDGGAVDDLVREAMILSGIIPGVEGDAVKA